MSDGKSGRIQQDLYEKLDNVQQELDQLFRKKLELSKAQLQRVKSHEEQKTWSQHLLGQTPLPPDPELQSVKDEIAHLETKEEVYFKILQAAASSPPPVPEVDWSKSPLFWKRLTKFGLITPAEQMNAYSTFVGGIVGLRYSASNFYRAHHLFKFTHCKEKTEEWTYHWARANATPEQIEFASFWIERLKFRGFAALGAPFLFVFYMWSKRKQ